MDFCLYKFVSCLVENDLCIRVIFCLSATPAREPKAAASCTKPRERERGAGGSGSVLFGRGLQRRFYNALPVTPTSTESFEHEQALTDEENERSLEERLDSHPDDRRSLRALMDLKVKAGKFRDAIAALDRLIELDPGENDLPLLKGHLLSYCGDAESAKQEFENILSEDPLLVEAYHGLVMAQREVDGELDGILKRIESALESCKTLKRKDDVRDFRLLIAQVKVIEDNYEEALKIYQELVREEPRDFRPYLCQGIIYTLLKKKDEAEKQFEKYRRLVPRDHPYSRYFDDNMIAMKVFSQAEENKRKESLKI
ncbi:hypothetical protein KSP39_PZI001382 [Platanthera zijinensis]|uniref:Protein SLOW GREEN 1, chloroplastic n=1 Tax=Platanthera zijinensis TaxID=2320716 RepID=A0AAP0BZH5_9ASPA